MPQVLIDRAFLSFVYPEANFGYKLLNVTKIKYRKRSNDVNDIYKRCLLQTFVRLLITSIHYIMFAFVTGCLVYNQHF